MTAWVPGRGLTGEKARSTAPSRRARHGGEACRAALAEQLADDLDRVAMTVTGHSWSVTQAIEEYRRAVELDPNFMATHVWFGRPYLEKGMYAEAIAELETAVKLSGESTLALAMLGQGLASAGRRDEVEASLQKLRERSKSQYVPSYWMAVIYNGFRDKEQVITGWGKPCRSARAGWCGATSSPGLPGYGMTRISLRW